MELVQKKENLELEQAAVDHMFAICQEFSCDRKTILLALSGGGSPKNVYNLFSQQVSPDVARNIHVLQVDERVVDYEDQNSNQRMIRQSCKELFQKGASFFPMQVQDAEGLAQYEQRIAHYAENPRVVPALVFLGMGADGHTASIFPTSTEDQNPTKTNYVFKTDREYVQYVRVSLTFRGLFWFKKAILFAPGQEKKEMLGKVCDKANEDSYPIARVLHQHSAVSVYASQ